MSLKPEKINVMGMELDRWAYNSCIADFGVGSDWATLYNIESKNEGKGDATTLLRAARNYYEAQGKAVGGTIALNPVMRRMYRKLGYKEYGEMEDEILRGDGCDDVPYKVG